ncbi:uncharacterized protein LOC130738287 isoform X7 [Lotus japonicus]|uniref:uncharacterized protein LOC130738287 isoform X7 n=1 Tax=Lotus japonicus TaxID=34305 RepID=UPI0025857629|nr:uncharacterized protein LOC130738287 isoform X7 [Lotus japonicus]
MALIAGAKDVGLSPSIVGSLPRKEATLVEFSAKYLQSTAGTVFSGAFVAIGQLSKPFTSVFLYDKEFHHPALLLHDMKKKKKHEHGHDHDSSSSRDSDYVMFSNTA